MVQTYQAHTNYAAPYSTLIPAYFQRYPNPLTTHVLSVDVLERRLVPFGTPSSYAVRANARPAAHADADRWVLRTTRLILKRGTLPAWAPRGLLKNAESWVLEESEVDLDPPASPASDEATANSTDERGRSMRTWTRNLDHVTVLCVTESLELAEGRAPPSATTPPQPKVNADSRADPFAAPIGTTAALNKGYITSDVSMLGRRIEKFGLKRFIAHADTSRAGLLLTHSALLAHLGGLSHTSSSPQKSKKARLAAALRPPFLDGEYVGPIARLRARGREVRQWWRELGRAGTVGLRERAEEVAGGTGRVGNPTEWLRDRLLRLRRGAELGDAGERGQEERQSQS